MGFGKTNVAAGGGDEEKLKAHLEDKNNPHGVTAKQVGLGNVPNVATNDQTPTFSVAGTLAALVSGEKLSVSMGKTAKAISDLISHLSDTTKHITAAERTAWNSKAAGSHTHDDRYYTEAEVNSLLAWKANTSHTHSMGDISGLSTVLANTSTLKLLAEYKTAGTRNVTSLLNGMAFVYAVIVGGGEGGEGGGIGQAAISAGAAGGDGGNIRIVGPLNVSTLTNKTVVVGAGGNGASSGGGNNPNHDASPGGTSSAFGFTASGGGNTPAAGEIKGGSGGRNDYSYSYTDVYTTGESLPLIDFFGIKSLSPGGGAGGTHHNTAGSAGGTSSVGNGGKGGKGVTTQGDGASGSPGLNGGCTAGGGGGGGGTCGDNHHTSGVGGKGGDGGPGYVAIYGIPKGV